MFSIFISKIKNNLRTIFLVSLIMLSSLALGIGLGEIKLRYFSSGKHVAIEIKKPESSAEPALPVSAENEPKTEDKTEAEEKTVLPADQKESQPEKDAAFSFAVVGDTQYFSGSGSFLSAIKNIKSNEVNLVFALGDLVNSCDGSSKCGAKYDTWKNALGSLLPITYAAQGNHDRSGRNGADSVWQDKFNFPTNGPGGYSELTYSLDFGNSHFVVLDSEKPDEHIINKTQRDWLEQDLARNKKANTFVFFHEPAYPVSSKIGESLDVENKDRNALWDIFVRHNVTAVFSGHEHINSRKNASGIYQFGIGNTDTFNHEAPKPGMAEFSYVGHHYAIVTVSGTGINVKIFTTDGNLINSFDFSK